MRLAQRLAKFASDPVESAGAVGLRYVSGQGPGIIRRRSGRGFRYMGPDGRAVRDTETLDRIRKLVIPPAWEDVWICPSANGHVQAVGRDARGRKQYRYHPRYRQFRNQTKFGRMVEFAGALPAIRERVEQDLRLPGLPKDKVLAAVVRLLETTFVRVGNDEYAKANDSYGLTTLRDRHVDVQGGKMKFDFNGKSGQAHQVELDDPRLAKIVKRCRDLPGYELFQYLDSNGERCRVDSSDVNNYLREITGKDFSAKDFRTWAGTVLAALALRQCGPCRTKTELKKRIVAAVKSTAARLGNRPATCRNYYVHPAVIDAYTAGTLIGSLESSAGAGAFTGLHPDERAIVSLIERHSSRLVAAA